MDNRQLKSEAKKREIKKSLLVLKDPFALIFYIVMLIYVFLLVIPMIWMIIGTFKDNFDFSLSPMGMPTEWIFDNYEAAFDKMFIDELSK